MRLDQMTVALRVRSPWQAMDLGLRMVRANARAIWLPYFLFAGSVFIICNLLAYALDQLWLGWFLVWWLKPVFDRIPLHVLSHVTFGSYPSFRDTLRAPFQWRFGLWFSWLTYRRFSFWRSMSMPIDILEGLSAERLSLRRSVLIGAVSSQMIGLSFICILFEYVLMISAIALFYMFIPIEYLNHLFENFYTTYFNYDPPVWIDLVLNTVYFLGVAAISPFYVGAGFAAYLNRRTQLEAWDIEIAFKRIATRLKQSSALVVLLAVFITSSFSNITYADDAANIKAQAKAQTLPELFAEDYRAEPKAVSEAVRKAKLSIRFDYMVRRPAVTDNSGWKSYPVRINGVMDKHQFSLELGLDAAYSSTCPCSAALARQLIQEQFGKDFAPEKTLDYAQVLAWLGSEEGIMATPHSQRSIAEVKVKLSNDFVQFPLIELIDTIENALKTPVQAAVKREDEQAFARLNGQNLMFCEDAARRLQSALNAESRIQDFWVQASHFESLHPHNAVAVASKGVPGGY